MSNKQNNLLIVEGVEGVDQTINYFTLYDALDSRTFQHTTYTFDQLIEEIGKKTFTDICIKTEKISGTILASLLNYFITLDCKLTNNPTFQYKDFEELLDTPTNKLKYSSTLTLVKE